MYFVMLMMALLICIYNMLIIPVKQALTLKVAFRYAKPLVFVLDCVLYSVGCQDNDPMFKTRTCKDFFYLFTPVFLSGLSFYTLYISTIHTYLNW